MAITITQSPNNLMMKRSAIMYVATSSNVAQPDFQFIVVVKQGATTLGKYYVPANPANRLMFDASTVIDRFVRLDDRSTLGIIHELPQAANQIFSPATTGIGKFDVEIGEYFGGVEYLALATDTFHAIDGATQYRLGLNYPYNEFQPTASNKIGWLTDRKNANNIYGAGIEINAGDFDYGTMCFINDSTGNVITGNAWGVRYSIYDNTVLVATQDIGINTTNGIGLPNSTVTANKLAYMGVLPANIGDADSPFTVAPSSVTWTYYELTLLSAGAAPMSLPLRIINTASPCKHEASWLMWQNQVGGWDMFRFDGRTDFKTDTSGKDYQKLMGTYSGTSFGFQTYDRSKDTYYISKTLTRTIRTDAITTGEQDLLANVLRSQTILTNYNGEWLPCKIKTSSYTQTQFMSRVKTVSFDIEIAQQEL
jgi:hypothetical protein